MKAALESPFCTYFFITPGFFLIQLASTFNRPSNIVEKRSLPSVFKNKQANKKKQKEKVSVFNPFHNLVAAFLSEFCNYIATEVI